MKTIKKSIIILICFISIICHGQVMKPIIPRFSPTEVNNACISQDNNFIAMVGFRQLYLWELHTGRLINKLNLPEGLLVKNIKFSNDSKYVELENYMIETYQERGIEFLNEHAPNFAYNIEKEKFKKIDSEELKDNSSFGPQYLQAFQNNKRQKIIISLTNRLKLQIQTDSILVNGAYTLIPSDGIILNDSEEINTGQFNGLTYYSISRDSKFLFVNDVVVNLTKNKIETKLKYLNEKSFAKISYNKNHKLVYQNGQNIQELFGENIFIKNLQSGVMSYDKDFLYCNMIDEDNITDILPAKVFDLNKWKVSKNVSSNLHNTNGKFVRDVSESGSYIKLNSWDYAKPLEQNYSIVRTSDGKVICNLKNYKSGTFIGSDRVLICEDKEEPISIINLADSSVSTSSVISQINSEADSIYGLKRISKNVVYISSTGGDTDYFYDIELDKLYHKSNENRKTFFRKDILGFYQNKGEQKLALFSDEDNDYRIEIYDINAKVITKSIRTNIQFSSNNTVSFSEDGRFLAISESNEHFVFDLDNQKVVGQIIPLAKNGTIVLTPDRYYYSVNKRIEGIHFSKGSKIYDFEQFDLKYNRPDIILDRLGYADSSLVNAYHAAYKKRLKKMGFTEDMLKDDFHLPEIEIENFEEMPSINDQGSIDIDLNTKDSKYKLDRINVWINDVAIYGSNGISLRGKDVKEYSTRLTLDLVKGKNKVQVSVLNQAGAESYKETFEIECTKGKNKPNLYLVTIGESKFQQAEYNLTYAAKDANDVATMMQKSKAYGEVFTKTLTNEQVTKENILELKYFLEKADINDQVMLFIAGHGVLDSRLDYYFATYDMDFENPSEKGLAYEDLEGLLDGIKPLKKTLLIDACHSGEIDKDDVELAISDEKEDENIQFRAIGNTAKPKLGMENTSELTKSLFTDLRKGTGATVISSAGGMEFAMESDQWKNGLFTYCMLMGIKSGKADKNKDGEIWLSELKEYISEKVIELSNGKQQPTSRIENQSVDFRVW